MDWMHIYLIIMTIVLPIVLLYVYRLGVVEGIKTTQHEPISLNLAKPNITPQNNDMSELMSKAEMLAAYNGDLDDE